MPARDEPQRELERHALTATLEVRAVGVTPSDVAELKRAKYRGPFVTIEGKEAIANFNPSNRRAGGLDLRHQPPTGGGAQAPTGILDDAVMTRDRVDRECQAG